MSTNRRRPTMNGKKRFVIIYQSSCDRRPCSGPVVTGKPGAPSWPRVLAMILLLALAAPGLYAQRTESMDAVVVPQNRITMRELGWPPVDVIPEDENGVTSLVVAPDGTIYGGTTGLQAHLFVLKPAGALVRPLGKIPGARSIHHSLVAPGDGMIYFGTSLWNRGRLDLRGKDIAGL